VLAAFLTADGHRVDMASNGLEGLRAFRLNPCEVVVTDKAMPGMSGDQMALAIKQFAPHTPIVLLTGFSQFLDDDAIPGIDVLATKPISMPNLRAAIRKAVKIA
jgi:CheY-like chemotaxis protein